MLSNGFSDLFSNFIGFLLGMISSFFLNARITFSKESIERYCDCALNSILDEGKELKIITVGSKGLDQIKREYGNFVIKKFSF